MSQALLKKYGWPILAVILLIILLLCNWTGSTGTGSGLPSGSPSGQEPPTTDIPEMDWVTCSEFEQDDTPMAHGDIYTTTWSLTNCDEGTIQVQFERFFEPAAACTGDVQWRITDSAGTTIFSFDDNVGVNTFDQYGGTPDTYQTAVWDSGTPWVFTVNNFCGQNIVFAYEIEMKHYIVPS